MISAMNFKIALRTFFCFVYFGMVGVPLSASAQNDEANSTRDELEKLLIQAIEDATRSILELEENLTIENQKTFFELDQDGVAELKQLARERLANRMEQFDDADAERAIEGVLRNVNFGSTFSMNGKEQTFSGLEPEAPFVNIEVDLLSRQVRLRVEAGSTSRTSHLLGVFDLPDFDERWKEVLERRSERDYADYLKMTEHRFRDNVVDMMLAIVGDSLAISPGQQDPLRKWLEGQVMLAQKTDVFQAANYSLCQIKELPRDLLTKGQQDAWQIMISELSLR